MNYFPMRGVNVFVYSNKSALRPTVFKHNKVIKNELKDK